MNEELNVNVGDEVLYRPASYSRIEKIATVTKVTPTGRIRIDKSTNQFDKYGRQMGDNCWMGKDYIYMLTPEKKEKILRKNEISKCICVFNDLKNKLTYEQAKDILNILLGGYKKNG